MAGLVGQAEAAQQNRQHAERTRILKTLRNLQIPRDQWPSFVLAHEKAHPHNTLYRQQFSPLRFQPPDFDRLNQSPEEWRKDAEAKFRQHCDRFLRGEEYRAEKGLDERIPRAKRQRGPGRGPQPGKRENTAIEQRYEFAARRLCGSQWKQIAADYGLEESAVSKAGSEVLRRAGWPRKPGTEGA